jgi:hypothetical protein
MNEKEVNEDFDREYEKYKNSPEYKEGFVKIKMPEYYIAKHSDEDLRAAVLAEREACAKLCESMGVHPALNVWGGGPEWYKRQKECAAAIRARGEK